MQKKTGYNILITAVFGLFLYLVYTYQDTDAFQSAMKFLFNPDNSIALPSIWQKNRMFVWGCLVAVLFIYYTPTWQVYRSLIRTYRASHVIAKKPPLNLLQASYMYRQDKALTMVTWLIDLCSRGVLLLHFNKGVHPWSITQTEHSTKNIEDQRLVDILFQDKKQINLKAVFHDPEPNVQDVAERLIKDLRKKNAHFFKTHKSSFPAWLLLSALIAEIPFYSASLNTIGPEILVTTIASVAFSAFPAYMLYKVLFSSSKYLVYILSAAALFFFLAIHFFLFTGMAIVKPYFPTAFYPDLMVVMIVFIYNAPLLPENSSLFSHLLGYKKYLSQSGYLIQERDLPWTLGLNIHAGLFESSFAYTERNLPNWLLGDGNDSNYIIKNLHQTFYQNVSESIYGRMKSTTRQHSNDFSHRM